MADRDALYRMVLEHPDDDTPRLVYADYVEEYGDPARAAFIRAQVELAKVPEWDPAWVRARFADKTDGYPENVTPDPIRLPEGLSWLGRPYRRGFPCRVHATGVEPLLAHGDDLFALAPVDEVEVLPANGTEFHTVVDLSPLVARPWFRRVRRLSAHLLTVDRRTLDALQTAPPAAGLTALALPVTDADPDALAEVLRPPVVARLHRLGLDALASRTDLAAVARAAGGPHRLRSLRLGPARHRESHGLLADPGLFDLPLLHGLGELDLSENPLTVGQLNRLIGSASAPSLGSLTLDGTGVGDAGAMLLAGAAALAGLRRLSLQQCDIGPAGAEALAASPHLRNLAALDLSKNRLGDRGVIALVTSPHLTSLLHLELFFAGPVGDRSAQAVLDSPLTPNLLRLGLFHSQNTVSPAMKGKMTRKFKRRVTA